MVLSLQANHRFGLLLGLTGLLLANGCANVKPWQRGALADRNMQSERLPLREALSEHVWFSREAATGGRSVGGSGCGCN